MRYPEFLKEKGTVGFIAPSFGCVQEPYGSLFDKTIEKFEAKGYKTSVGPNCRIEVGIGKSNTPEECAKELNDYFINDKSDIIISCGGGETMCEDLPFTDFAGIGEAKPKWFIGYSDNTNLTFTLNTLCDTASVYGPCAATFSEDEAFVRDSCDILTGRKLKVHNYDKWYLEPALCGIDIYEDDKFLEIGEEGEYGLGLSPQKLPVKIINDKICLEMPYKQRIFNGERDADEADFSGRLIGGCLDCLCNLVGTGFDKVRDFNKRYASDGIVWFIESCELGAMSIRRALWQLENAGWFENVKGFIIGRPMMYNDSFNGFDRFEAIRGALGKYNVPIVMDIDLGHLSPAMPIISGAIGNVKARGNEIEIEYVLK